MDIVLTAVLLVGNGDDLAISDDDVAVEHRFNRAEGALAAKSLFDPSPRSLVYVEDFGAVVPIGAPVAKVQVHRELRDGAPLATLGCILSHYIDLARWSMS